MKNPVLSFRSLTSKSSINSALRIKYRTAKKNNIVVEDCFVNECDKIAINVIEDLLTFCSHVVELFNSDYAKKIGLIKWIDDVRKVMVDVLHAIIEQKIDVGSATYGDNEELEMIEDVLDNIWQPNFNDEFFEFLSSVVGFWLQEIRDRGYVVHGLLSGSEDFFGVESSLKSLKSLNYPPEYGI